MAKDPAIPFYASDYLGSQAHAILSPEQRSAYLDLLFHQWMSDDCALPDDDEILSRLSGVGEGWFKGGSTKGQPTTSALVRRWFPPHPTIAGKIANRRVLELRAERDCWREKSRIGGHKSAEARKLQQSKGGSRVVQPKGNSPSPSPSPSPVLDIDHIEIASKKEALTALVLTKARDIDRACPKLNLAADPDARALVLRACKLYAEGRITEHEIMDAAAGTQLNAKTNPAGFFLKTLIGRVQDDRGLDISHDLTGAVRIPAKWHQRFLDEQEDDA